MASIQVRNNTQQAAASAVTLDWKTGNKDRLAYLQSSEQALRSIRRLLDDEFEITWRMLADNVLASFTPGIALVFGVCLRHKYNMLQIAVCLSKECLLASCYTYIFDAVNQAAGEKEDRINKPHRPIPRGLLTPKCMMQRFWVVMAAYSMIGWWLSVSLWVSIWQATTVIINMCCPPPHYTWCKTLCMMFGVGSQLAQAWQLVTPMDETGRRWILFMAICFPPPLIFEDVRDMAGDGAIGRKTFALLLGERPVRVWFAVAMSVMPLLVHVVLFEQSPVSRWRIMLCDVAVMIVCWIAATRSLAMRTVKADRMTYQLFILSYIVVLCCGCVLWV